MSPLPAHACRGRGRGALAAGRLGRCRMLATSLASPPVDDNAVHPDMTTKMSPVEWQVVALGEQTTPCEKPRFCGMVSGPVALEGRPGTSLQAPPRTGAPDPRELRLPQPPVRRGSRGPRPSPTSREVTAFSTGHRES